MHLKNNKNNYLIILINLFLFISSTGITIYGIINGTSAGQRGENMSGISFFKAFTNLSNIFMGVCALIIFIELILMYTHKIDSINQQFMKLYLLGVNSVCVTFITVLFFLAPMSYLSNGISGFLSGYLGYLYHFHLLNPILAVISFILLESHYSYNVKDQWLGILPVGLYSIVYVVNVIILKNWEDFYGFTFGGRNYLVPIVLIIMYLLSYFISYILIKIREILH